MVLNKEYEISKEASAAHAEGISIAHNKVEEVLQLAAEKGNQNATVLEKVGTRTP